MADSPPYRDPGDDSGVERGRGSTTGTPRWVKVSAAIAIVMVLLIGALMLFGGGSHGPGRHGPSGETGGRAPPGGELGVQAAPEGGHQ